MHKISCITFVSVFYIVADITFISPIRNVSSLSYLLHTYKKQTSRKGCLFFYLPVSFLFPVRVRFLGCEGNGRSGGAGDAAAEDEIAELLVCLYAELERRKGLSRE